MTSGREKTIGELIDSLITTDLRCWTSQDKIFDESLTPEQQLEAAKEAQRQNAKRSQLIAAINGVFGETGFTATKTYTYFKDNK